MRAGFIPPPEFRLLPLLHRRLLDDLDAEAFQANNLARVVREKPDLAQAEIGKDLRADAGLVLQ